MTVQTQTPPAGSAEPAQGRFRMDAQTIPQVAPADKSTLRATARRSGQAKAAELRALACAAWHRECAGRYLAWCDSPWAAAQYERHLAEGAYQDALAARHAAVAAALQGVDHG